MEWSCVGVGECATGSTVTGDDSVVDRYRSGPNEATGRTKEIHVRHVSARYSHSVESSDVCRRMGDAVPELRRESAGGVTHGQQNDNTSSTEGDDGMEGEQSAGMSDSFSCNYLSFIFLLFSILFRLSVC